VNTRVLTFLLCLALPLSGLIANQSALAEQPSLTAKPQITMRQEGNILYVQGVLNAQVSREVAWAVLTDYMRFPEFVPGVLSNRMLSAVNTSDRGLKRITQRGQVSFGQFKFQYDGIMQVVETHGEGLDIVFLSGPFKDVTGAWRLTAAQPVKLSYSMRMDLTKAPFPPPLTPAIAQQQVSAWVEAFAREMERTQRLRSSALDNKQAAQASVSPSVRRKD